MKRKGVKRVAQRVKIEALRPLIDECFKRGKSFTFKPNGISMLPFIRGGRDDVTIEPFSGSAEKYDIVFFQRADGKYVMHRVIGKEEDGYIICGDNQHVTEKVSGDMIFAVVTKVSRGGKEADMNAFLYKIYCRTLFIRRFYCHVKAWLYYHFVKGRN